MENQAPGPARVRVFISYSREDMVFTDRLEAALRARGFEPLVDRTEIYAFEDWWKRLQTLIGSADTVVFVLSPDAVTSTVALREVAYAAALNKRLAPIVHRRVDDDSVPEPLRRLNFIFFDDDERFDTSVDKLAEALHTNIGWIRRQTEFGEAARRWIEAGRAGGLLLRPPLLDQAETWLALRPAGAPVPTAETETLIAESRKADTESRLAQARAQRRWRGAQAAIYVLLISVILGLVGWINQDDLIDQWRWFTVTRPYAKAYMWDHVLTRAQEQALKPGAPFKECASDCPEMVVIPAGSFEMGSPPTERGHAPSESPQHTVTIAQAFAVSRYQVTFADWDACVAGGGCNGYEPADQGWGHGRQPVINVDWDDARQYVTWLSRTTGKTYRLLSEAEYEYAARAGTTTAYPWGDSVQPNHAAMANCNGCGSNWDVARTAPVGSFPPNQFGLYDMIGNVFQWTEDCVHGNYQGAPTDASAWVKGGVCTNRVVRGGSFGTPVLRSASRIEFAALYRSRNAGFRVARTLLAR